MGKQHREDYLKVKKKGLRAVARVAVMGVRAALSAGTAIVSRKIRAFLQPRKRLLCWRVAVVMVKMGRLPKPTQTIFSFIPALV